MIIIVEGIDRVGKSTLCEMLTKEFNIPIHKHNGYLKYSELKNTEETDKVLSMLEILNETNGDIIFDRLYFSDYVYGLIERDYPIREAALNLIMLDKYASEMKDVFLIYVLPTDVERSSREHGKDLKQYDNLFSVAFKDSRIENKFRCTYNTLYEVVQFIKSKGVANGN